MTREKKNEMIDLADGREVPKVAVDAITDLENRWPGASFHGARPAIAWYVLNAVGQIPVQPRDIPEDRTNEFDDLADLIYDNGLGDGALGEAYAENMAALIIAAGWRKTG